MLKKVIGILCLLLSAAMLFCGCSGVGGDTDSLLSPPRPAGELYNIQQTLQNSVNESYTLKYPVSGDYRSAIIQKDLDNDGVEEAIAFYSTTKENVVTMHILLIVKETGKWVSRGDIKCVATGVESVTFGDISGDGNLEIIVGWTVYGTLEKNLCVYTVQNGALIQRISESYNNFLCDDLQGNGKSEIFLVNLNTAEQTAVAKLITLTNTGIGLLGSVSLDPNVSGYSTPVVSKLPNGNTAVYIDAIKGSGVITEVLELKNGGMVNAVPSETGENAITFRASNTSARDIDSDGICEIPIPVLVTQAQDANDNVYRTEWCVLKDGKLQTKLSAFMNETDGYFVIIPEKWKGKVTVTRDTGSRIRTIMRIDEETGNSAQMLVKIQTCDASGNASGNVMADGKEIAKTDNAKYFVSIGDYSGEQAVTFEEFKNYFKILGK